MLALSLAAQQGGQPEPPAQSVAFDLEFVQAGVALRQQLANGRADGLGGQSPDDSIRVEVLNVGFDARAAVDQNVGQGRSEGLASPVLQSPLGTPALWLVGDEVEVPTMPDPTAVDDGIVDGPAVLRRRFGITIEMLPLLSEGGNLLVRVTSRVDGIDFENARTRDERIEPGLTTRGDRAWITIEPGQSFVIRGLMGPEAHKALRQIPGVSDRRLLSVILDRHSRGNGAELVVVATPRFVTEVQQ